MFSVYDPSLEFSLPSASHSNLHDHHYFDVVPGHVTRQSATPRSTTYHDRQAALHCSQTVNDSLGLFLAHSHIHPSTTALDHSWRASAFDRGVYKAPLDAPQHDRTAARGSSRITSNTHPYQNYLPEESFLMGATSNSFSSPASLTSQQTMQRYFHTPGGPHSASSYSEFHPSSSTSATFDDFDTFNSFHSMTPSHNSSPSAFNESSPFTTGFEHSEYMQSRHSHTPSSSSSSSQQGSPSATRSPGSKLHSNTKVCTNCGAISTPMWRRNPSTHEPLCNACGIYLQTRHKQRPPELINADGGDDSGEEELPEGWTGPVCSHCSTRSTSVWRRSKEGAQLCNACGVYVRLRGKERPLSLRKNKVRPRVKHE